MRRLVGGAVLRTGEREVDANPLVRRAVSRAVRAGLELQEAGRAATSNFERRVRDETRRHTLARQFATCWRGAVRRGGPRRAAALQEAAHARRKAEEALATLEASALVKL